MTMPAARQPLPGAPLHDAGPAAQGTFAHVVCGIGLTAASAMTVKAALARVADGGHLTVVHVAPPPSRHASVEPGWGSPDEVIENALRSAMQRLVGPVRPSVTCELFVERGRPAERLAAWSRVADLLVVGGGAGRQAQRVLRQASCPVLVVPETSDAGAES